MIEEKCIPCEAAGRDSLAVTKIEFNDELIPCCEFCSDLIEANLFTLDEESGEQEDY